MGRHAKWDNRKADRVAARLGITRSAVVAAWRAGRRPGIGCSSTGRTQSIDLSLTVLANLSDRPPLTLQTIAEVCGCSREAVRQIEAKALRKVRSLSSDIFQELRKCG